MSKRNIISLLVLIVLMATVIGYLALRGGASETFTYDFSTGDHGWTSGWVDLPETHDPGSYQLRSGWRKLPENLGKSKALYISSMNMADDIFMFFKKRIDDLETGTMYDVAFSVELASKYPKGSIGIGGSPADSVYLKGGVSIEEPVPYVDSQGWLRLNVDKGGQSQGGEQATVLGTVAKPDDGTDLYKIIERDNQDNPVAAKTDEEGRMWIFFGTDSGFEGLTELYYKSLTIILKQK